jgi:uncharacterized membrane protein YuzA (DUF378 family)
MRSLSAIDWTALIILIIGGLNWGLIGFFKFDLVSTIFGDMTAASRVIYALVGLSAIYIAVLSPLLSKKE